MQTETIVTLFIPFTIMMIMLSLGLTLRVKHFLWVLREPLAVMTGCCAQLILLPALGFGVAWWLSPSPQQAVGLVLVASCPGGPSSNLMTRLAGGDVALSVTLTAVSGCLTMITIPLYCKIAASSFAPHLPELSLPILNTIIQLALVMGAPLIIGMMILAYRPSWADRIERPVKHSATLLLMLLIIGALLKSRHELAEYGWFEVRPAIILSVAGMTLGLGLSVLLKLKPAQRVAIPIEVGTQNGALAIGLALTALHSQEVAFPCVVYGTFMYLPCALMVWAGHRYMRELKTRLAHVEP